MRYRCSHCGQNFELDPKEYQRCPNCFWTTSLILLEGRKEISGGGVGAIPATPRERVAGDLWRHELPLRSNEEKPKLKPRRIPGLKFWLAALGILGIAAGGYGLVRSGFPAKFQAALPKKEEANNFLKSISIPFRQKSEVRKKALPPPQSKKGLSAEETALLKTPFRAPLARSLADDEKEILAKRVSFPAGLIKKPELTIWSNKDFETFLDQEQRRRGIRLGWMYERSLKKIFEKHYLGGAEAYEKGNYFLACDEFIQAIAFPVYQNDVKLHRAVALVMLRSYVNDVLGKLAVLNQYFIAQSSLSAIQGIVADYGSLFGALEALKWEEAAAKIESLKGKIKEFENRPAPEETPYPPSLATLDAELQQAVRQEAAPKADAVVQWKALLTDLDLKEKIVRENLPASLANAQAIFDEALELIEAGNLNGALEKLKLIQFPPELAEKAKEKILLIQKALALEEP